MDNIEALTYNTPLKPKKSMKTYYQHKENYLLRYQNLWITLFLICSVIIIMKCIVKQPQQSYGISSYQNTSSQSHKPLPVKTHQLPSKNYVGQFCSENDHCKLEDLQVINIMLQMLEKQAKNNFQITAIKQPLKSGKLNELQSINEQVFYSTQFWDNLQDYYNKQTLQQLQLSAVKHVKLTSPRLHQKANLLDLLFRIFSPYDQQDSYRGIQQLFDSSQQEISIKFSSFVWESSGYYLTVRSQFTIRPAFFRITLPEQIHNVQIDQRESTVIIIGLNIQQNYLISQKTFSHTFLGKHSLKGGNNWIKCEEKACFTHYSLILFALKPMKIRKLQIFQILSLPMSVAD